MKQMMVLVALVVTALLAGCGPQSGEPAPAVWLATVKTDVPFFSAPNDSSLSDHCMPVMGGPEGPVIAKGTKVEVLKVQGDALYALSLIQFSNPLTGATERVWIETEYLNFEGEKPLPKISRCGNL